MTVTCVACLALGIGVNTTMFLVVDGLLYRPPPQVRSPDRVVRVYVTYTFPGPQTFTTGRTSFANYADLQHATPAFERTAAYASMDVTLGRGPDAVQAHVSLCTASLFPLLEARAAIGRFFGESEDRAPGEARVAVLGYDLWHGRFASDSSILAKTVWIGGGQYSVIGVAPQGFTGADPERVDAWLPIHASLEELRGPGQFGRRVTGLINIVARLRDGVSFAQATGQATTAIRRGNASDPDGDPDIAASMGPIQRERGPDRAPGTQVSLWAAVLAMFVLLIACGNAGSLLLARGLERTRELAVRHALGAGRARLVRQLLIEGLLLAACGGVAALVLTVLAGPPVRTYLVPAYSSWGAVLDSRGLASVAVTVVAAGLLAGLAPALVARSPDLTALLKGAAPGGIPQRLRLLSILVVAQVALTTTLLVGVGLLGHSLLRARAVNVGVDMRRVLVVTADLAAAGYQGPSIEAVYRRALDRVRRLPDVEQAAVASSVPFRSSTSVTYSIPGHAPRPRGLKEAVYVNAVTPEYFATMGMSVRRGRGFTVADGTGAPPVAVVNETMARFFWPNESPIGGCIKGWPNLDRCSQVVGVISDALRMSLLEAPTPQWYVPLAQSQLPFFRRFLLVRAAGAPLSLAGAVRREFRAADPDMPFVQIDLLSDYVDRRTQPFRLGTIIFGAFGALAAVLVGLGVYSLVSFAAVGRTLEIGVRVALGAQPRDVFSLVMRQGLLPAAVGVAIGMLTSLALGRMLSALLFGVAPHDLLVLTAAPSLVLALAAVASYVPAWRATRMDATLALQSY